MGDELEIEDRYRRDAHRVLDRWLDECGRQGTATFADGRHGYIGRIKLCAFVDDEEISLRVERSFSEDV